MIVVMQPGSTREQVNGIVARIKALDLGAHLSEGEEHTIIGVVGSPLPPSLEDELENLSGVERVVRITKKYKLTGWDFHPQKTRIRVRDVTIGGEEITIIAGPCSVENEEQTVSTARAVSGAGTKLRRRSFGSERIRAVTSSSRRAGTCQANSSPPSRAKKSLCRRLLARARPQHCNT